jgi:hypothetical protein
MLWQRSGKAICRSGCYQAGEPANALCHKSAEDAKPLPAIGFSARPVVARAYEIGRQIPVVLAQQPCYCQCDKAFGHTGLLDCFTSFHTGGCGICMETLFAFQTTKQGKPPAEIRDAITRGDWRKPATIRTQTDVPGALRYIQTLRE